MFKLSLTLEASAAFPNTNPAPGRAQAQHQGTRGGRGRHGQEKGRTGTQASVTPSAMSPQVSRETLEKQEKDTGRQSSRGGTLGCTGGPGCYRHHL